MAASRVDAAEAAAEAGRASPVVLVSGLVKPRQTLLLSMTILAGYAAAGASRGPVGALASVLLGSISIAAVTALNMVIDADIDAVMGRTRWRPLARGLLPRRLVAVISLTVFALSLAASYRVLGPGYAAAMAAGMVLDIVFYTVLTKRRTPWSIVPGSLAGAMPILGGWLAGGGGLGIEAAAVAGLVAFWTPVHTWLLGLMYRGDYAAAGVPVLPVVSGARATGVAMVTSLTGFAVSATLLAYRGVLGPVSVFAAMAVLLASLTDAVRLARGGEPGEPRRSLARVNTAMGLLMASITVEGLV